MEAATATEEGFESVVKALLHAGADPTLKDEDDETALHKAAERGNVAVAEALLASPRQGGQIVPTPLFKRRRIHKSSE